MIDADALMEYCNNQKVKTVSANDIARFPNVTTEPGWISVKERLPERGTRVIVIAKSNGEKHITIATFGKGFQMTGRRAYWRITHWMSLPDLPKEEEHEQP